MPPKKRPPSSSVDEHVTKSSTDTAKATTTKATTTKATTAKATTAKATTTTTKKQQRQTSNDLDVNNEKATTTKATTTSTTKKQRQQTSTVVDDVLTKKSKTLSTTAPVQPPSVPPVIVSSNNRSSAATRRLIVPPSTPSSKSRSGSSGEGCHLMTQMLSSLSEENCKNLQRLHLVIDLDATFVSTRTEEASYHRAVRLLKSSSQGEEALSKRVYLFSIGGTRMWTILRPGALEFMEFASFYFKRISVWSAGQKDYVDQIVSFLFPAHIPRPSIVFNWDDCAQEITTYSSVEEDDNEEDDFNNSSPTGEEEGKAGQQQQPSQRRAASPSNQEYISFTKPLVDIIPHAPKGESIEHMLILDDRRDIAEKNIENLVQIPPFEPPISLSALSAPDNALDKFVEWLMRPEVINAKDIRKIDKTKIFLTSIAERRLQQTFTSSTKDNTQSQKV